MFAEDMRGAYLARLLLPVLLLGCATSSAMEPFSTDGCSLFPDRFALTKKDWCNCCLAHDLAYWRGGTAAERLKADEELRACVLRATKDAALSEAMFAGVRAGGGPYFFTPYRWGYGWKFGRAYQPLSAHEEKQASVLRSEYVAKNPSLACTKP